MLLRGTTIRVVLSNVTRCRLDRLSNIAVASVLILGLVSLNCLVQLINVSGNGMVLIYMLYTTYPVLIACLSSVPTQSVSCALEMFVGLLLQRSIDLFCRHLLLQYLVHCHTSLYFHAMLVSVRTKNANFGDSMN